MDTPLKALSKPSDIQRQRLDRDPDRERHQTKPKKRLLLRPRFSAKRENHGDEERGPRRDGVSSCTVGTLRSQRKRLKVPATGFSHCHHTHGLQAIC
jgi:hypothetical protein